MRSLLGQFRARRVGVRDSAASAAAVAVAVALALLIAPEQTLAGPDTGITQTAVSTVTLDSPLDRAYGMWGVAPRRDRLEGGWVRLSFREPEIAPRHGGLVEVYSRGASGRIAAIVVTDRRWRTATGVGPCSTLSTLLRAYGRHLVPIRLAGRVAAYRFGNLFFAAGAGARVSAVQLSSPSLGPWLASNAPACEQATN